MLDRGRRSRSLEGRCSVPRRFGSVNGVCCQREGAKTREQVGDPGRSGQRFVDRTNQSILPILGRLQERSWRKGYPRSRQGHACRVRLEQRLGTQPAIDAEPRKLMLYREGGQLLDLG